MKLCGNGSEMTGGARAQVLRTASAQFAMTGLHGTTALALAQAAGISEANLHVHFGNKTLLFREAVEINTEMRLRSLRMSVFPLKFRAALQTIMRLSGDPGT